MLKPATILSFVKITVVLGSLTVLGIALFYSSPNIEDQAEYELQLQLERRSNLSNALAPYFLSEIFPKKIPVSLDKQTQGEFEIQYTINPILQTSATRILQRYKPDYGAIFIMDAKSGAVLAWSSFERSKNDPVNLVSRATYPSASIFKIITAAAAIDGKGLSPHQTIKFNGGNHTLYRKNVLSDKINRWTRTVTLKDAFAHSYNTPFGRLGLEKLTPELLKDYAERFMFNKEIYADFPVEPGTTIIPDDLGFEFTEVASGFTRSNRMSPVQGAMIAAAIVNNGTMVMPYVVESLRNEEQEIIYQSKTLNNGQILDSDSAEQLRELMEETVLRGTSRKTFRPLIRDKKFGQLIMGGKTGHLTGDNPKGRSDWFVGYASDGDRKIALAALTVNKEFWTVKSSHLVQSMIRAYYEPIIKERAITSTTK